MIGCAAHMTLNSRTTSRSFGIKRGVVISFLCASDETDEHNSAVLRACNLQLLLIEL